MERELSTLLWSERGDLLVQARRRFGQSHAGGQRVDVSFYLLTFEDLAQPLSHKEVKRLLSGRAYCDVAKAF